MSTDFRLDPALTLVHPDAFVAYDAVVVGDVHVHADASIWYGAVLRGDTEAIRVHAGANVQDGTILHADPGFPCTIGEGVTVGHRCIVHGATVGARSLLGMGAILMNGASIGAGSVVGAGALVTEGKEMPGDSLILGSPARVLRALTDKEREHLQFAFDHYVQAGRAHKAAGHQRDRAWPWRD